MKKYLLICAALICTALLCFSIANGASLEIDTPQPAIQEKTDSLEIAARYHQRGRSNGFFRRARGRRVC